MQAKRILARFGRKALLLDSTQKSEKNILNYRYLRKKTIELANLKNRKFSL